MTTTMSKIERLADTETGPRSEQITDTELHSKLKSKFLSYWPSRKNDFFPAPQPVSLERRDIFRFKKFPYLACVKSDGMRFVMICTEVDGKCKTYMVNRAFRYYEVNQCFGGSIFKGTMFDGELVKTGENRDKWTFIIHDCIAFCGEDITQKDFTKRYECVLSTIETHWEFVENDSNSLDSFPIDIKKFYKFKDLDKLILSMNDGSINHKTDGLIFTPINLGIGMHTQYTLFKWKPRKSHTFDFKVVDRGNLIVAQVNEKGELSDFAGIEKNTEVGKMFMNKLKGLREYVDGSIVECDYNEVTECFEPLLIRTDKTHPNGIFTVDKTLLNIRQNITIDELVKLSKY
jgi:mRNA guanylyltransferase